METLIVEKILNRVVKELTESISMVDQLQELGYILNFELAGNKMLCTQTLEFFYPKDFQVDHIYRTENLCCIYGLSNPLLGIKGIFFVPTSHRRESK